MTSFSVQDPRVVDNLSAVARVYIPPADIQDKGPSAFDVIGAAFQQENLIASAFAGSQPIGGYDPTFDPFDRANPTQPFHPVSNPFTHIQGFEDQAEAFVKARNIDDLERIKNEIKRELKNREVLADGGAFGITAMMAAAILDPLIFVPFGGVVKGVRGISAVRTALKFAAAGGSIITTQELLLHQTQLTRTSTQSAVNITGGSILSGMLGAAIGRLTAAKYNAAVRRIDDTILAMADPEDLAKQPAKVRARILGIDPKTGKPRFQLINDPLAPNGIDVKPLGSLTTLNEFAKEAGKNLKVAASFIPGFNRLSKWISPRLQLFMSKQAGVREAANQLLQSPVLLEGGAKAFDAETAQRLAMARSRLVQQDVENLYAQHATGNPKATAGLAGRIVGFRHREGTLTRNEFYNEVARAMRGQPGPDGKIVNVDVHAIPEVQQAAQLYRSKVINPLRDVAIDLGLLPKEILANPGYLTRLYNHELFRTSQVINGKVRFPEQEAFIDAIVEFEQKLAAAAGTLDEFSEAATRQSLRKALDQILSIPDGRLLPGAAPFRGPMLERTLKVPDAVIERWLLNDTERIISYYTRAMAGDLELIKRFGLVRVRPELDEARSALVKVIRDAEKPSGAIKSLRSRDKDIVNRFGGRRLGRAFSKGRQSMIAKLRKAKTEAEAVAKLAERDDDIIKQFSSGNLNLLFDRIDTAYRPQIKAAEKGDSKLARKLRRERHRDIRNLTIARDTIRGTFNIPADPTAFGPRFLRGARQFTYMTIGGSIALSSIPDLALPIFNRGFANAFRHALLPMLTDMRGIKLAAEEARLALGPSEVLLNSRSLRLFDLGEDFLPRTRIERGLEKGTHAFSLANFMAPWNQAMRNFSALTTNGLVIESAIKVAAGQTLKPKTLLRLQELGLSENMLKRIADQYDRFGGRGGRRRAFAPNTSEWTDDVAKTGIRAAIERASNLDVIKGSPLDRPAIPGIGPELSKTIFMFMNFGLSANTRILGRGLQYRDATVASASVMSVAMGILAVFLKDKAANRDVERTPVQWVAKGFEQAGVSGAIWDFDRYLEQATSGRIGVSALLGTHGARYYSSETMLNALFGPAIGKMFGVGDVAIRFGDLEVSDTDRRRLRRLIPLQNHFLLSRIFDQLED